VLAPHYQRPVPSMSVVQFVPSPEQLQAPQGFTIDRGARLDSKLVGGIACKFRTAYPTTLWPIEVESARLDPDRVVFPGKPPAAVALLQLTLRATGGAAFSPLKLDRLRFFFGGSGPLPVALFRLSHHQLMHVNVPGPGGGPR